MNEMFKNAREISFDISHWVTPSLPDPNDTHGLFDGATKQNAQPKKPNDPYTRQQLAQLNWARWWIRDGLPNQPWSSSFLRSQEVRLTPVPTMREALEALGLRDQWS